MSTPDPEETEQEADRDELLGLILSSGAFTGSPAKNTSTYELVDSIISAGFRRLSESEMRREAWIEGVIAKSNSSSIFDRDVIAQCPYPKEADRG